MPFSSTQNYLLHVLIFFFKYVNSKRRSKEKTGPVLVEDGHLTNRDEEKAEAFNVILASVFNNTGRPWTARSSRSEDTECGNSDFPFMDTEIVGNQLYQLKVPWGLMGFAPEF